MNHLFSVYVYLGFGLVYKVLCLGMFEVAILRLNNNRGVNQYGRCCSGARTTPPCTTQCRTYFSVCLMHSIQAMPLNPPCTYGSARTGMFPRNNLLSMDLYDSSSAMKIPINFSWPGRFTLLVESWHEASTNISGKDSSLLIIRSMISRFLYPSLTWRGETTITPTTEIQYKYRFLCLPNFYGSRCDVSCRPRDDLFGHYTCGENGTKICMPGWDSTFCDKAICSDECLQNNGFCERPYECRCPLGWLGADCGQCQTLSGCLNGICYEPYQCICNDGWRGVLCDIDVNYCSKGDPCLNGGTCQSNLLGNYTCLCPDQYKGENCQIPLCYDGYCQNLGQCQTHKWSRSCTCTAEFYGDICQHRKLHCDEIICHNEGICKTGDIGGYCECQLNTTGKFCETKMDACSSNPCDNGADCIVTEFGYRCKCLPNYAGRHCDYIINPCLDFECSNGGLCLVKKGYSHPICDCPMPFTGDRCQISLDPCYNVNCLSGGSCQPSPMGNGFVCHCLEHFHGEFCEEVEDLCQNSPCENGAACKNYITSFLCICTSPYYGERCEREIMLADIYENVSTDRVYNTTDGNNILDSSSVKVTFKRVQTLSILIIMQVLLYMYRKINS